MELNRTTPLPRVTVAKAGYGELWARLIACALIVAGAAAGIASRWTP